MTSIEARKAEVLELKAKTEELVTHICADLKAVGAEVKSVEDIANVLIEAADDATNTGLMEPFDGPGARILAKKLLKTTAGQKVEAWYQAIRAKILQ